MKRRVVAALCFSVVLVVVTCSGQKSGFVMSTEVRAIVMSATTTAAYRVATVDDEHRRLPPKGRAVLASGAVVLNGPVEQNVEWLRSLQRALAAIDSDAELNSAAKECDPTPGVAVRFSSPKGKLDMLICYECEMLAFAEVESKKVLGWWNFDSQNEQFIALAKRAFPNDKVIQGLH